MLFLFHSLKENKSRHLYKRLILSTLIIVSFPILLIGIVFYTIDSKRIFESILTQNKNTLIFSKNRIEQIFESVELQALQLVNYPLIKNASLNSDFNEQYIDQMDILNNIDIALHSNKFIDKIAFYNYPSNLILCNDYGYVVLPKYKYSQDITSVLNSGMYSGWYPLPVSNNQGYITYIQNIYQYATKNTGGIIMFQISAKKVQNELNVSPDIVNGLATFFLMDDKGDVIYTTDKNQNTDQFIKQRELYNQILSQENMNGYFTFKDLKNKKTICTFNRSTNGRIYISTFSKEIIYHQLVWVKGFTILILFSLFIISFLLIIISSERIYTPIENLIIYCTNLNSGKSNSSTTIKNEIGYIQDCLNSCNQETKNLQEYIDSIKPKLKKRFLKTILEGKVVNHSLLYQDLVLYDLSEQSSCIVVVLNLAQLSSDTSLTSSDRSIMLFTIQNIMEEILYKRMKLQGYVVDHGKHGADSILIFGVETSHSDIIKIAQNYAKEIYESIKKYVSLQVTIGIGRICTNMLDVSISYNEAMLAIQLQVYEDNPILYIEDIENHKNNSIPKYPLAIENAILCAQNEKDMNKLTKEIYSFSKAIKQGGSYLFIKQSYEILLGALLHNFIKDGGNTFKLLETNPFNGLWECRTSQEIQDWLVNYFLPLYKLCDEDRNSSAIHPDIEKICNYITENVNKDLSLVQCAELVNMNPSYLSRIFKKETDKSFIDFVTERKIEQVKKLLIETDYSITEIATTVGYSERSLYRIFVKYAHMSPGNFRENFL